MAEVLEIISQIIAEKKQNKVVPPFATYPEIKNRVGRDCRNELNLLYESRRIIYHKTLNSISFSLI